MDVHRAASRHHTDYRADRADRAEPKHGPAAPPWHEDRVDSGLGSLKEDELVHELEELHMDAREERTHDYEPWRRALTDDGDSLLHLAIIHEATDQALQMIKVSHNHPYLDTQNHQRQTALHLAVITDQPQLVERLLEAGADPRLADDGGDAALHLACKKGSMACFSLIAHSGRRHVNAMAARPNYSGHNCLHLASINGYISLVESLVQLGADINAQEQCSGRTPLHLAVDLQNPALVLRLLQLGADVNCLNYGGFAPYHLTYGRHSEEIRRQLYEKTARELRRLPDSESDDSDGEDASEGEMYDDIKFGK